MPVIGVVDCHRYGESVVIAIIRAIVVVHIAFIIIVIVSFRVCIFVSLRGRTTGFTVM